MELIKIKTISSGHQTVNARDLWEFLGIKRDFSSWIKDQIERARLVENRDFVTVTEKGERKEGVRGASFSIEYHLSIEAAKHIAMMSGSDKGFEVRDYFIECENRAKSIPAAPTNMIDFLRQSLDAIESAQNTANTALAISQSVETRFNEYHDQKPIEEWQCAKLTAAKNWKVTQWLNDYPGLNSTKAHQGVWRAVNAYCEVAKYRYIPEKMYVRAMEFITSMQPHSVFSAKELELAIQPKLFVEA